MTAKHVAVLREQVRKLFEIGDRKKEWLLRNFTNPFTGETPVEAADRINKSFLLYLDSPAFDPILEALDGPKAPRQAAHIMSHLRHAEQLWRQSKDIHPATLIEKAMNMELSRQRASSLLSQLSDTLSTAYAKPLEALRKQVEDDVWPIELGFLFGDANENDHFSDDSADVTKTKPVFDLKLVGRRGASSKPASAWRALRVRALDARLPSGVLHRNATIAKLLDLGGAGPISPQNVRSILAAKPKNPRNKPTK